MNNVEGERTVTSLVLQQMLRSHLSAYSTDDIGDDTNLLGARGAAALT